MVTAPRLNRTAAAYPHIARRVRGGSSCRDVSPNAPPLPWIGLVSLPAAALLFDGDTPFPGWYALVPVPMPVLGAALVLAGGCRPTRSGAGLLLSLRPLTWVGGLSYGWYL